MLSFLQDKKSVILDSDFIFAIQNSTDASHQKALEMSQIINKNNYQVFYLNIVKQEIATLISRRIGQSQALKAVEFLANFESIFVDEEMENEVWKTFGSFAKKNISFVDCANLTIARKYKLKIASLDAFYPSEFLLD